MNQIATQTAEILAMGKILLFFFFVFTAVFILRQKKESANPPKPWIIPLFSSIFFAAFYAVISYKMKRMWWGNNGDEMFVGAFLTEVLNGNYGDFYYNNLPAFYPPLYFWVSGSIARFFGFGQNAISAAKLGVTGILVLWFFGTYIWCWISQKMYERLGKNKTSAAAYSPMYFNPWLWVIYPFIFFALTDFDTVIVKPYETITALLVPLFLAAIYEFLKIKRWSAKEYLFFGISGGLLFLTFYFWWIIIVPAILINFLFLNLGIISCTYQKNSLLSAQLFKIFAIFLIILIISSPFWMPLIKAYSSGFESWQAIFFVSSDLHTFLPFANFNLRAIFLILGILGMVFFCKSNTIKSSISILMAAFAYQFANIFIFLSGKRPALPSKPFLFLGTAAISLACAYFILKMWKKYLSSKTSAMRAASAMAFLIFILPLLPPAKFLDDPVVGEQIEKNQSTPQASFVAEKIKKFAPDYKERTWLSSGTPDLNLYIPLHYYIAHNMHFSHGAAMYSKRMETIKKLEDAKSQKEFAEITGKTEINAMILYAEKPFYPIILWIDNFPNGGKEAQFNLKKEFVEGLGWKKIYSGDDFVIFLK